MSAAGQDRRPVLVAMAIATTLLVAGVGFGLMAATGGASDGPEPLGPGAASLRLDIDHSLFSTDRIVVTEGTELTFDVRNNDPIVHELIVGGPEIHERHEEGHEAWHPPRAGEVTVDPGGRGSTTFRFDEPGTVTFACHLPGHLAYGMTGEVVVEPAS